MPNFQSVWFFRGKIARYNGPDPEDIEALIERFDISAEEIETRAEQALAGYVGNLDYLRMNLRDVLGKARKRRPAKPAT